MEQKSTQTTLTSGTEGDNDELHEGMRFISGGVYTMGSEAFYPEEAPRRKVRVDPFWIDEIPVTNKQFAAFIEATGYITLAEIAPDPDDYPGMPAELAHPASLVFEMIREPVDPSHPMAWWNFIMGANWRHPLGPGSSIEGREDHPVVHVAYQDALAYSAWRGKSLPTEAEWEFAARGGRDDQEFAWGDSLAPGGAMLANFWQGRFPFENSLEDGWERTSPVRTFPPNAFGLFDMIGNVWEWTEDWWSLPQSLSKKAGHSCCAIRNPRGGDEMSSVDPLTADIPIGRKVMKGGSHLCAENYCQRYRPAARHPQSIDTSTSHIGFRCVIRKIS